MTDITTAAEAARITAENEASHEVTAQAAPDDPNPEIRNEIAEVGDRRPDPTSDSRVPTSEAPPLERITAADRGRAEVAARFKEKRAAQGGEVEFHGDMRDPSQTYGPLGLAPEQRTEDAGQRTDEQPPAQPQQTASEAPLTHPAPPSSDLRPPSSEARLVKVKVHGREAWLPEDQVIAEAQKSLAAGNLLESAKEVLSGARHPGGQAQTSDDPSSVLHPASSQSDPYVALAHTLQLEGAEAAGPKLRRTIEIETARARQEAAREAARQVRLENELAVSSRALAAFETSHPDLASDEFARDAVTTQVQREINADLKVAVDQGILKEMPPTQDERNSLHTQLRAFGAPVRAMGNIFQAAGEKYQTWRGGSAAPQPHKPEIRSQKSELGGNQTSDSRLPASAQPAPRIELSPDRAQRRASIPTQPTNGTVPPRAAPPPEQTTAGRRSAAIMAMRKARGQIVA